MLPAAEAEATFTTLLPDFTDSARLLPELPGIVVELLHQGHSPLLHTLRATSLAPSQHRLLVRALTELRLVSLRNSNYRVAGYLLEHLAELLQGKPALEAADLIKLFDTAGLQGKGPKVSDFQGHTTFTFLQRWLAQLDKLGRTTALPPDLTARLRKLLTATDGVAMGAYYAKDLGRLRTRAQALLSQHSPAGLPAVHFDDGDAFGQNLNAFSADLSSAAAATQPWLHLLLTLTQASGSRPTPKFTKALATATAALGPEVLRQQANQWLALLASLPVTAQARPDAGSTTYPFLLDANLIIAKGLVWAVQPVADAETLHLLASLATKCYRKIPGRGPLAVALGNACLLALSQNGLPGVAALARVRPKIKQTNTQALITGYIENASRQLGVTPDEIEDMAVPDYDLRSGAVDWTFGEYMATLTLAAGKAEVRWSKAYKPLKAAPTTLKSTHAAALKDLKNTQTQAQQTFVAQRERLDRSFVTGRRIAAPWFRQYYVGHGLLSLLVHGLIWRFHHPDRTHTDAIWLANAWRDAQHQPVASPTHGDTVELWHPVLAPTAEVLAWRALLEAQQVQQPLKQAFREVYLLTPPEERTRTYSNRMAAHVLKQHQFSSLAKLRDWKYNLLGAYDKGYDSEIASLLLPTHGLRAEFWVSEVNADGAWNDTGIYNYVSTDQVRFVRGLDEVVPLPEIAPLVFSEVMRDVDLFVGVASVGNDPQWRDNGGLAQYRNYWESYSFGELGEVAKNRKLVLERLVPRLKIGKVSEIRDKFLVVKGKRRTYKIHMGSGNILMEPNDQYLCIVPDRSAKNLTADVFLPFEGDAVLSIILSKALLLMDDDKITDETILRQLA